MKEIAYVPVQNEDLATKLKRYRLQVGFTQKNVAEILNVSRSTYTYYELGKTSPDPATLNRIARLFGLSVEEFFEDEMFSQADMLYDSGAKRVSKKVKADPEKIGDLTTSEKSIVAFLRDKRISPDDALDVLKERFSSETKWHSY
ncbi:helix-turn-helix transcriptional regulator [Acutalibacter muris]|nr:helix-turn-helix transcriptional regulator [Acutalibacter muris]QQR31237.1 helix-turn-helix transcriptional regulator [Acutalibacter muris]